MSVRCEFVVPHGARAYSALDVGSPALGRVLDAAADMCRLGLMPSERFRRLEWVHREVRLRFLDRPWLGSSMASRVATEKLREWAAGVDPETRRSLQVVAAAWHSSEYVDLGRVAFLASVKVVSQLAEYGVLSIEDCREMHQLSAFVSAVGPERRNVVAMEVSRRMAWVVRRAARDHDRACRMAAVLDALRGLNWEVPAALYRATRVD